MFEGLEKASRGIDWENEEERAEAVLDAWISISRSSSPSSRDPRRPKLRWTLLSVRKRRRIERERWKSLESEIETAGAVGLDGLSASSTTTHPEDAVDLLRVFREPPR